MQNYSNKELNSIYQLGILYYDMGFFAPAERVLQGLVAIDKEYSPAKLGLGLIKIEKGLFAEAAGLFREVIESGNFNLQAKLGLVFSFLGAKDISRAKSILNQVKSDHKEELEVNKNLGVLLQAAIFRCGGGQSPTSVS